MAKRITMRIDAMRDETLDRFFEKAQWSARFRAKVMKKFGPNPAPQLIGVLTGKHKDGQIAVVINATDELKEFMSKFGAGATEPKAVATGADDGARARQPH